MWSTSEDQTADLEHQEGKDPGDDALAYDHTRGLEPGAQLPSQSGDGSHTGSIQQGEYQKAHRGNGGK